LSGKEHNGKGGPFAIVNENSQYPYAHFAVPIGLPMPEMEIKGARRRDVVKEEKLSSPTSKNVTSFSSEPSSSQGESQSTLGTVVSLPPENEPDANVSSHNSIEATDFIDFEASHAQSNGAVKQFLRQIPDLSFMLKSSLSLPKKGPPGV
jgi:hypothetical protein